MSAAVWLPTPSLKGPAPASAGRARNTTKRRRPDMAVLTREIRGSYAFVERNFNLVKRYWGWEVGLPGLLPSRRALSVTLIGKDQGSAELILYLVIGAIFWNYLSVVFSFIAETDHLGALGGHARVHDDGAGKAHHPSARLDRIRAGLWLHPHRRRACGPDHVLRDRPVERRLGARQRSSCSWARSRSSASA